MSEPIKSHHHFATAIGIKGLTSEMAKVNGLNAKFAVFVTTIVGSMWCAYAFSLIALLSLPAILTQAGWVPNGTFPHFLIAPGLILIVAWVAQTFIQLVLLSVIMVGQSVQSATSDARAVKTYEDTETLVKHNETVLDKLNEKTEGGIKTILDRLDALELKLPTPEKAPLRRVVNVKPVKKATK